MRIALVDELDFLIVELMINKFEALVFKLRFKPIVVRYLIREHCQVEQGEAKHRKVVPAILDDALVSP